MAKPKIFFTKHAKERYMERFDRIDALPETIEELTLEEVPRLEKEICRKGRWFSQLVPEEGNGNYLCIVNNLKVYRAVRRQNGDVVITTAYAYTKKLKDYLNTKMERCTAIDESFAYKRD